MPYQPVLNTQIGPLLAQGFSSAGQSLAAGLDTAAQTRAQADGANNVADLFAANHPELFNREMQDKFHASNLAGKQKMLGQLATDLVNQRQQQELSQEAQRLLLAQHALANNPDYQAAQLALIHGQVRDANDPVARELAQKQQQAAIDAENQKTKWYQSKLNEPAFTPALVPMKDANGKTVGSALMTSPNSAVPWQRPQTPDTPPIPPRQPYQVTLPSGAIVTDDGTGRRSTHWPRPGEMHTGGSSDSSYQSAADVRAAFRAGKLDGASATKILQTQFGMQ